MRAQYQAVGESMRRSADQLVPIAKMTPHRVMREVYEQLIAYSRAYADAIPTYSPRDNDLARVSMNAANVIVNICAAIEFGSAASRAPLVTQPPAPSRVAEVGDPAAAEKIFSEPNGVCSAWASAVDEFEAGTAEWVVSDASIPASRWSPQQRKMNDEVIPVMENFAQRLQELGEESKNATFQDFADLSAQYRYAFIEAIPTYLPEDKYLASVSSAIAGVIHAACRVVRS
ncbi:hypothetical protein [Mycolicibacterium thermoresistibile]